MRPFSNSKNKAAGGKRRPGATRKQQKHAGKKRKTPEIPAAAAVPSAAAPAGGGDDDDFLGMLNEMEDYRPVDDAAAADGAGGLGLEAGGGSSEDEAAEQGAEEGARQGGKKAKRRRRKGQKLTAMEFEARRQMVRQIAECPAQEQADWLWASFQQHAAASALERGALVAEGMAPLPAEGPLEERLKALQPGSWQQEFCGRGGGGKQQQQQRPPGSPSLLLVSPSAIGAVGFIKLCPKFHQACRIGKLFAKHMKVPEQRELLRTQVLCIGAGTPNRLCKLADDGTLRLDCLKHVVLDVQLDTKQRDILAIPGTRADWWSFYDRHLKQRLDEGSLKLSLVNSDDVVAAN